MRIEKYKPTHTPHLTQKRQDALAERVDQAVSAGREAIARARLLLEDSQKAIARSRSLARKRH